MRMVADWSGARFPAPSDPGQFDSEAYYLAQGVEFRAYGLKDGESYTLEIPGPDGKIDAVYTFTAQGEEIRVKTESGKPFSLIRMN